MVLILMLFFERKLDGVRYAGIPHLLPSFAYLFDFIKKSGCREFLPAGRQGTRSTPATELSSLRDRHPPYKWSGCGGSNSDYKTPSLAYYRYTTPRCRHIYPSVSYTLLLGLQPVLNYLN